MKTPEGRLRNQENKKLKRERNELKRKHEEKKAFKAGQEEGGSTQALLVEKSKNLKPQVEDEEIAGPLQLDNTNGVDSTIDASNESTGAPQEPHNTHDVTAMSIISSSHIQQKVKRALEILSEYPAVPPAKPKAVMLHSKASVASKMITIAEITKREIVANGGKWYQYNKLGEVVEEKKDREGGPKRAKTAGSDLSMTENGHEEVEHESEEDFETMKTPFERAIEGKPKIRAVPVMTLYLSRVRIDSLRKDHT
jgi:Alba